METLNKRAKKLCKHGRQLYKVYAFPESNNGHIWTMVVTGKPYLLDGNWFCDVINTHDSFEYMDTISLSDANIIPNDYNNHRTFTKLKNAKKYLECITNGTHGIKPKKRKWFSIGNNSGCEGIDYDAEVHGELAVLGEDYEVVMYEPV